MEDVHQGIEFDTETYYSEICEDFSSPLSFFSSRHLSYQSQLKLRGMLNAMRVDFARILQSQAPRRQYMFSLHPGAHALNVCTHH
jgi:hypothetical protein